MIKKNKNWRYYKKTVILRTRKDALKYEKEALENGFDVSPIIGLIAFGLTTRDMTPVITVHEAGIYWGRLWWTEKLYGRNSALEYTTLPVYTIDVDGLKVIVSKESFDAFGVALAKEAEAKRKALIWKPDLVRIPKTMMDLMRLNEVGYKMFSAEFMHKETPKSTEIAGVKPLTLYRYTEEYVKKFGAGVKRHNRSTNYFIAYNTVSKFWTTTYSSYTLPFVTLFNSREDAEKCMKWLKDLEVIK